MGKTNIKIKARLILENEGKLLLLEQIRENGGNYTLVGGTVNKEEFARKSLIREAKEEADIVLLEQDLELVHVLHKRSNKEHRINLYFKANQFLGSVRNVEQHKFRNIHWYDKDCLPENITDTAKQALNNAVKGILYSEIWI